MKQTANRIIGVFTVLCVLGLLPTASFAATFSAQKVRDIIFPVLGATNYSNDWHAPRSGHLHQGNDIFGKKGQPLIAAVDGRVRFAPYPQPSYGYIISIEDADGYEYWYLHVNNDTPGTDDGNGGGMFAYAPGIESGALVKAGQLVGWMGDSGNAERTASHLHFELHEPDGDAINPFFTLQAARHISKVVAPIPQSNEIFPFGGFTGGTSIAVGNVDPSSDGEELVVAAGPGGGPNVRVYSADRSYLFGFFAYPSAFHGGVDVATADVDGNGVDEIVTATGRGGGGEVHVYDAPGTLRDIIFPYSKFNGEVHVSAADLDGDGIDEIIAGAGRGGGPDVQVMNGEGTRLRHFFAYASTFRGGIDVAAVDATETASGYIVTVPLAGGGPHVRTFTPGGALATQFFAYNKDYRGGVRVDASLDPSDHTPRIVTVPGGSDDSDIRIHALDGSRVATKDAYEEWWRGGYDVGAGDDGSLFVTVTSPARRATVREVSTSFHFDPNPGPNPGFFDTN